MRNDASGVIEIDESVFEREVLRADCPVLVTFAAPWSKACQVVNEALKQLAVRAAGSARVVRVNADENPDLGVWYDVQSVPTLICFVDGQERARIVGTASAETVWRKVGSICQRGGFTGPGGNS